MSPVHLAQRARRRSARSGRSSIDPAQTVLNRSARSVQSSIDLGMMAQGQLR